MPTRAPVSSMASKIACAMATPWFGSVPLPSSSMRTSALLFRLVLLHCASISRQTSMCPEKVDKSPLTLWMSPISARTGWKKSTRAPGRTGRGIPVRTMSANSPINFKITVLPPLLGPVNIIPWLGAIPNSMSLPTTVSLLLFGLVFVRRSWFNNNNKIGCCACFTCITPWSWTCGMTTCGKHSCANKYRARATSSTPTICVAFCISFVLRRICSVSDFQILYSSCLNKETRCCNWLVGWMKDVGST